MSRALKISLGVNVALLLVIFYLVWSTATSKVEKREVLADAKACSDSVQGLAKAGQQRDQKHAPKIQAARKAAQALKEEADQIQATPPAVPGNACASAQADVDAWWKEQPHAD